MNQLASELRNVGVETRKNGIRGVVIAGAILATFCIPSHSLAAVLIDNLAEPLRGDTNFPTYSRWAAQSFVTDGSSYTLTSIETPLGIFSGSPTIVAELRADSGSQPTGTTLTTFTLGSVPSGTPSVVTLTPDSSVSLDPTTTYWLVIGLSGTGSFGWSYAQGNNFIGPGSFASYGYSNDGVNWFDFGSDSPYKMRVNVSATSSVPEPNSSLALLGAATALGIGTAFKRKSRK